MSNNRDVEVTWICPNCLVQNFDNLQTTAILCWSCEAEFDWWEIKFSLVEKQESKMDRECAYCGLATDKDTCPSCEGPTREALAPGTIVKLEWDAYCYYTENQDDFPGLEGIDLEWDTFTIKERHISKEEWPDVLYDLNGLPITMYAYDLEVA